MSLSGDSNNSETPTSVSADAVGIAELAECQLRGNSYLALRNISCELHEGVLTLRGCVPTYYLKQMAQTVVSALPGVPTIINLIDVGTVCGCELAASEAHDHWEQR